MYRVYARDKSKIIDIGHAGENKSRCVIFDISPYKAEFGEGTWGIAFSRDANEDPYLVTDTYELDDNAVWELTSVDTAIKGRGRVELRYKVNDVLVKTDVYTTELQASLGVVSEDPPSPTEDLLNRISEIAASVKNDKTAAEAAAETASVSSDDANTAANSATQSATAAAESANTASEAAKKVEEIASTIPESFEELTNDVENLKVNKADQTELDKTNKSLINATRRIDAMYKLNQGVTYQFETDDTAAYTKDVPSGAKLATVNKIGGKTIVWNQLTKVNAQSAEYPVYDIKWTNNGDGSVMATGVPNTNVTFAVNSEKSVISVTANHKYLIMGIKGGSEKTYKTYLYTPEKSLAVDYDDGTIWTATENIAVVYHRVWVAKDYDCGTGITFKPQLFDLTQMFGEGNEPSTIEEFEAMFPDEYYEQSDYTLLPASVDELHHANKNICEPSVDNLMTRYGTALKLNDGHATSEVNGDIKVTNSAQSKVYGYYIPIDPNITYAVSATCKDAPYKVYIQCVAYNADTVISTEAVIIAKGERGSITVTTPSNATHLLVGGISTTSSGSGESSGVDFVIGDIQIEKGSSATDYTPYKLTKTAIPQAVLDLDGYGDAISDDIYNYVDFETKTYHKRVVRLSLDGVTTEHKFVNTDNAQVGTANKTDYVYAYLKLEKRKIGNVVMLCDKLPCKLNGYNSSSRCWFYSSNNNSCGVNIEKSIIGVTTESSKEKIVDAVNNWIQSNNLEIVYELAEEEVTDISDILQDVEPIEVDTGDTLTFKNSNGDGYRLPVPSETEYIVSLAEVSE